MPEPSSLDSRKLRIAMIAGNRDALHCGVKDYAQRLVEELNRSGHHAEVHAPTSWSPRTFLAFARRLRAQHFDILHLHYPSIGFRYSLLPHLLGLLRIAPATVVTLHEHTRLPRAQRLSTYLFRLTTKAVIFTTPEEQWAYFYQTDKLSQTKSQAQRTPDEAQRFAKFAVIPIAANVPTAPPALHRNDTILYFGQLRPDKGLEAFLTLARLSPAPFAILGACVPRHAAYLAALQAKAPSNVAWHLGLPLDEIATHLASAHAAYLPFPDGATYRRGSLLAALANGLPVLTTVSAQTPPELVAVVFASASPAEALAHLHCWQNALAQEKATCGLALVQHCTWPNIAAQHTLLYHRLSPLSRPTPTIQEQA